MKKKLCIIVACLALLLVGLALTVNAAGVSTSVNSVVGAPGSQVSFTVSLPSAVSARSGGLSIEYDSNVLQLVSGQCNLSGTSIAEFKTDTEKGVFLYMSETSLRGNVFTITFKVKDTAPLGTYSVKLNLQLRDKNDNDITVTNTAGTLKICKFTAQKIDSKYLASAATCTSAAKYYYSCEDCGAKGTSTFTHGSALDHSWSTQYSSDNTHHWYACTRKGCTATNGKAAHTGGTASCTSQATCTVCNKTYGGSASHSFTVLQHDENDHWYKCANCPATDAKTPHRYGGDHICDVCSYTINIPGGGTTNTVTVTVICGSVTTTTVTNEGSQVTVTFAATAGETFRGWQVDGATVSTDATYTFTASKNMTVTALFDKAPEQQEEHTTHTPSSVWTSDGTHHWQECTGCTGQQLNKGEHVYDGTCDEICNTCGATRTVEHDFTDLANNKSEHWYECTRCHAEKPGSRTAHVFGDDTQCDVCEYGDAPQAGPSQPANPDNGGENAGNTENNNAGNNQNNTNTEPADSGCGSTIRMTVAPVFLILLVSAAWVLRRKEKTNA